MIKGKVEPFAMPTMVRAMPIVVYAVRQIITIPQMISPKKETTKGAEARDTTAGITTREIVEGVEPQN
jgi:hypothetical protein